LGYDIRASHRQIPFWELCDVWLTSSTCTNLSSKLRYRRILMWIPDWCNKVHQLISQIGSFHIDAASVPNWVFLQLLCIPNLGKLNRSLFQQKYWYWLHHAHLLYAAFAQMFTVCLM
jgi:hypothetical protein